jgi:hypothetical protein
MGPMLAGCPGADQRDRGIGREGTQGLLIHTSGEEARIVEGSRVLLADVPEGFVNLLAPVPGGVAFARRASKGMDVVVLFATRSRRLEARVATMAACLERDGRLWVA